MVREVSLYDMVEGKDDGEKVEALNKIAEGLATLAKLNVSVSQDLTKAIQSIPETKIDFTPLLKAIEKPKPVAYTFDIQRNATKDITKVVATPNERN
jgi:hypothetical protein